jgi:hypothetical protein
LIAGGALGASGWIAAYLAVRQNVGAKQAANDAAERARLAETKAAAADAHVLDAEARAATAIAQRTGLEVQLSTAKQSLQSAAADRETLLEQLAQLGAPVGADLLDSSIGRLYADRDRQAAARARGDQGPGPGPDPVAVPAAPAVPAAGADPHGGQDV